MDFASETVTFFTAPPPLNEVNHSWCFAVTTFDERHCHKWALLLRERHKKLNQALTEMANEDFIRQSVFSVKFFMGFPVANTLTPE